MQWTALVFAIAFEVAGTLSLRVAATGRPAWYAAVIGGYVAAFAALSVALADGLPLGVAYGIWAATGVAATAVLSRVIFKEPLTTLMLAGIGVIAVGVLLVELGGH